MKKYKTKMLIVIGMLFTMMGVGYAIFGTNLKVQGTAKIYGDWNIYISDITEKSANQATTVTAEVTGKTTANFNVQLEKPGSYVEYEVTVKNDGNLDAILKAVNGIEEANEKAPTDIKYSIQDLEENAPLFTGEEIIFIVRVELKSTATTLPTTNKELLLSLDFEQSTGEITIPPVEGENAISLIQSKNTAGNTDGLITDNTSDHNIRYVGSNSGIKNYVTFNHETWRIVGIFDGKIKIVRDSSIGKEPWNHPTYVNNWNMSSLNYYLNGQYYHSLGTKAQRMIADATYYFGTFDLTPYYSQNKNNVSYYNGNIAYEGERRGRAVDCTVGTDKETSETCPRPTRWTGKIALLYVSDYKNTYYTMNPSGYDDENNNWIHTMFLKVGSDPVWFLNTSPSNNVSALVFEKSYSVNNSSVSISMNSNHVYPTLHLNSNVKITSGDGSSSNPYQLGM